MGISTPMIVIPFILVALVSITLAVTAWRRSRAPGSSNFALMMLAVAVWLVTAAIETSVATESEKMIWAKIGYLGISWVSTLWLAFALEFTYPESRLAQHFGNWLGIIPAVTMALAITNDWHGLIWNRITPLQSSGRLILIYSHGAWFWVFAVYSYLVLLAGVIILVRGMLRFPQIHRRQVVGLVVGMILPWAANMAYILGWNSQLGLDFTPFGFAVTGIIYAWTLFRLGLFDLVPLAHEAILKNIGEGYLVLDPQDRLVEINSTACHFLDLDLQKVIGRPSGQVLSGWPDLLEFLADSLPDPSQSQAALMSQRGMLRLTSPAQFELVTRSEPPAYIEATLNNWYQGGKEFAGRILILHDITRRRYAERQLCESERLYRLLVNTSPVGIVLTDKKGNITFASPQVSELFGASESTNISGQSVLQWIHPEDRALGLERMSKTIENQKTFPAQEYRLLRVSGAHFWGEISSVPVLDDQGTAQGLLSIIRDVTTRKELELQLKRNLEQQTFIKDLLQFLYRPRDLTAALNQVLERTGMHLNASRVYLCQDSPDGSETTIFLEWCSLGMRPRAHEGPLVRYAAVPSWRSLMENGGMVVVPRIEDAPPDLADFMNTWNTLSFAAFPIYGSEERLYGFLGLDYRHHPDTWDIEDVERLWSVCRIVSGAVAQREVEGAEQRQRALAEALHDTSSALNSSLNFEEVLDRILSNLSKVVEHDAAAIALVDDDSYVHFVRWRGYDAEGDAAMRTVRIPLNERETYRSMAQTGTPVIIADTWLDKRWMMVSPYEWIRSFAGVPILIKGKVAGFINLDSRVPEVFTPDLSYSLHVFADQAAVAIENARLYDSAHRRAEEMSSLYRIGMTLTAGLDVDQIMVSLFEQCCKVLPIDVFYVALYDASDGRIDMRLYYNEGQFEIVESRNINERPGITGQVILQRQTIYLADATDPELIQKYNVIHLGGRPTRSYVGVPLILLDQVVGVISMQNMQPFAYTSEQISLLETIATQAAIAVQNARLYNQMKQMAITDSVTQLSTRRHFTALGRSEVERALRYNRALSVLMVDIDHFKQVNDTYGHNAGDQILQVVANVTRQALRINDIIGRWGGEEFALVIPEADKEGALLIAERIRRMVSETDMQIPQGIIHITISIGVATLSETCCNLETLIDGADRAMYLAKQSGRNRVCYIEE